MRKKLHLYKRLCSKIISETKSDLSLKKYFIFFCIIVSSAVYGHAFLLTKIFKISPKIETERVIQKPLENNLQNFFPSEKLNNFDARLNKTFASVNNNEVFGRKTALKSATFTKSNTIEFSSSNFISSELFSIAGNYYRSAVAVGDWANPSSWQYSSNNEIWETATSSPTSSNATSIVIQNGHKIAISTGGVSLTKTIVQKGGTLEVATHSKFNLSGIENEIELIIEDGGIFLVNGAGISNGNAYGLIKPGGKLIAGAGIVNGNDFATNYLGATANGLFYFGHQSVIEWSATGKILGTSSIPVFFKLNQAGDMPIFRLSVPMVGFGSTTNNFFNAILESNEILGLQGSGTKTFVGGIKGTSTVAQNPNCGNLILGDGTNIPIIGGSVTLNVLSAGLQLPNGANIPAGSNPTITGAAENNTINRQGGNLTVDGILDLTNIRIKNTAIGGVVVNGTLKTSNSGGILGTNSAIPSESLTLNTGSTVDYNGADQRISSAPNYYNITFSGTGTKTTQGPISVDVKGLIKITGTTTVDASSNLALPTSNATAFTMDGGRLILRTGGTQPNMQGVYNLTGGVVEFASSSLTNIRTSAPPNQYYNVEVSGTNVITGGKRFIVNNILKVTAANAFLTIPENTLDSDSPFTVTAKKGIQVLAGKVLFKNNAVLMQDTDAKNIGNIHMERKANVSSAQYNYWSSPVDQQDLYSLYPGIPDNSVMIYNSSNDKFTILTNSSSPRSTFAKGYSIKGTGTGDLTATFVGVPNNENSSGGNTINLSTLGDGYNLIGNPFPSYLDLVAVYNDPLNTSKFNNEKDETPTAYFWDNMSNTDLYQLGSSYGQFNYALLNLSSGIGVPVPRVGGSGKKPDGIVKPGQGFIIRAAKTGGNLTFRNNTRTSSVGKNGNYFKGTPSGDDRFWLKLTTPQDVNITIAFGYDPNAKNSFDRFDTVIFSDSVTENFYSLSSDQKKLSIQGREGDFSIEDIIPLGIKTSLKGLQKISLDEKEGVFDTQPLFLKDKLLNLVTNLSENDYQFTSEIGQDDNRFEIIYKPNSTLSLINNIKSDLLVFHNNDNIKIKSDSDKISKVEIYDISGKLHKVVNVSSSEVNVDSRNLSSGVYILNITRHNVITPIKILKN
jgi:hypothetical protein